MNGLFQDWRVNEGNPKSRLVLVFFRAASRLSKRRGMTVLPLRLLVGVSYRLIVEWSMGIELPWKLEMGPRVRLYHGFGLVINDGVIIGSDVILRHGVTIGHTAPGRPCPRIGNGVEIGAGAIILGDITVGDGATIGAGAVVVKDVPQGAVVVGNPAHVISARTQPPTNLGASIHDRPQDFSGDSGDVE
jgi:serine acetyltransferase